MKKQIPNLKYEKKFIENGYKFIAGIDEVGRGPWAGPVVAAAVILSISQISKFKSQNLGINDSKKLSEKQRNELDGIIREMAVDLSIGEASVEEIDKFGIQFSTYLAYERAIHQLKNVDFLLIDGLAWKDCKLPSKSVVKGDSICMSIAAASIVAKVYRDNLMTRLALDYSSYGFEKHKGYGTKLHLKSLEEYGICEIHRKSFKPIKKFL